MGNMELPFRIEGKNLREGGKNNSSKDQKSYKDNVKKKKKELDCPKLVFGICIFG